jgi:hypothetical protein
MLKAMKMVEEEEEVQKINMMDLDWQESARCEW